MTDKTWCVSKAVESLHAFCAVRHFVIMRESVCLIVTVSWSLCEAGDRRITAAEGGKEEKQRKKNIERMEKDRKNNEKIQSLAGLYVEERPGEKEG